MSINGAIRQEIVQHTRRCTRVTCPDKNLILQGNISNLPQIQFTKLQAAELEAGDVLNLNGREYQISDEPSYSLKGLGSIAAFILVPLFGRCKHYRNGVQLTDSAAVSIYKDRFYVAALLDVRQGDVLQCRKLRYLVLSPPIYETEKISQIILQPIAPER